jgi:hypothetical protein
VQLGTNLGVITGVTSGGGGMVPLGLGAPSKVFNRSCNRGEGTFVALPLLLFPFVLPLPLPPPFPHTGGVPAAADDEIETEAEDEEEEEEQEV